MPNEIKEIKLKDIRQRSLQGSCVGSAKFACSVTRFMVESDEVCVL